MNVFIWVQHLFGQGHVYRMARLAEAAAIDGARVTVATGGASGVDVFAGHEGIIAHRLPPLSTSDAQYTGLLTDTGQVPDADYWAARQQALQTALRHAAPDVLLIELFPFGRRKFASEVLALVEAARTLPKRPLIVSSVRDIVEPKPDPAKQAQMAAWLAQNFDAVLVHGDESLVPLTATAPFAAQTEVPLIYTGYIAPTPAPAPQKGGVVVSAGSGPSGAALLDIAAAVGAEDGTPDHPWHLFTPPGTPQPHAKGPHLHVHGFSGGFAETLARAAVSIGEAGYNSTVEALAAGTRPVLVPYDGFGQTEQPTRAVALAAAGLAVHVPAGDLSPARLRAAIAEAHTLVPARTLNLSGAAESMRQLKALRTAMKAS